MLGPYFSYRFVTNPDKQLDFHYEWYAHFAFNLLCYCTVFIKFTGATVEKLRMLKADARPVGIVVKVLLNWAISKLSISNHTVLAIHALYGIYCQLLAAVGFHCNDILFIDCLFYCKVGHQEEMSVCLVEVFKEVFKNNCEVSRKYLR